MQNKVNKMDCIEMLRNIPSNTVQCVFADPPFNLNKKYRSYKDVLGLDTYLDWVSNWVKESMRVLKDNGSIFIYNIPKLLLKIAPTLEQYSFFRHLITWNSPGKPLGKTLQPSNYGILYYTKRDKNFKFFNIRAPHQKCRICNGYIKDYGGKSHLRHYFGYSIGDVWNDIHRLRHKKNRIDNHPCQLPVHLIERIILLSTEPGDIFVDLFAGGGSGGIAAKQLGRQYIGADIDEYYVDLSNKRINQSIQQKINNVFVSQHLNKIVTIRDIDIEKAFY